ncbi:hypothetical protein GE107_18035 [Cohnella sp. CFH 77786]|uniref:hypothetical protein n=1 Tax=Cohnella sp. CFH 77786 TaxID=2662265 RepID=UPI001C609D48|nr:hypothetical protein [Cohnella sp. CFH 77786]MBW5447958.1 hypothetical protein [Cohnella sp. CFH 77786]
MSWGTIGVLVLGAVIGLVEAPGLFRRKKTKELWMFLVLLAAAIASNLAAGLPEDLPTPLDALKAVFEPIGKFVLRH